MCLSNTLTATIILSIGIICALIYYHIQVSERQQQQLMDDGFANMALLTSEPIDYHYRDYPYLPRKYLWHLPEHTWVGNPRFDYAFGYDISGKLVPIPPNVPARKRVQPVGY